MGRFQSWMVRSPTQDIPQETLALWLKADQGVITSGSLVTAWNDSSGNNRNFTKKLIAGFPTKVQDGAFQSVRFTSILTYNDANASVLELPSGSMNFTSSYTVFVAMRADPVNATIISKSTDASKRRKYQISLQNGIFYSLENANDVNINYNTGSTSISQKRLLVARYLSNSTAVLRYNGSLAFSTTTGDFSINATNSAPVFIGASPFQPTGSYNGEASRDMYLYEIIFYSSALSDQDVGLVEQYLNQKYSIY